MWHYDTDYKISIPSEKGRAKYIIDIKNLLEIFKEKENMIKEGLQAQHDRSKTVSDCLFRWPKARISFTLFTCEKKNMAEPKSHPLYFEMPKHGALKS